MKIVQYRIVPGGCLELHEKSFVADGEPALVVVTGAGRGGVLRVDAAVAGAWLPLRGRLQFGTAADHLLPAGEASISEAEKHVRVVGRGNAIWVALLGTAAAWRRALETRIDLPTPGPLLLPARHAADAAFRRCGIALARAARAEETSIAVERFLEQVLALQQPLSAAIARCPGRSYAQRRQVFLRMQRVRNYLAANCHLDLDNDALARMANYSPWHFIRAFRNAYGETPHAYLIRQRLERAQRLLRTSPLAIAEVAAASGFENRCAFSRLFRQRFGRTALELRREGAMRAASIAAGNAQLRQRFAPV